MRFLCIIYSAMDNAATTPHEGKSGDHQHHHSAHTKARRKLAKYENTDQGRLRLATPGTCLFVVS